MSETLVRPLADIVRLLNQTDLMPSPEVDALFAQLVATALNTDRDQVALTDPPALAEVRRLSSVGESNLEAHWAARILADPRQLNGFPYLDNYRALALGEFGALTRANTRRLEHVVFAGCGPLPLTALTLHEIDPGLRITCLDVDPVAARTAQQVITALARPDHRLRVINVDEVIHDHADADAVLLAALAGSTPAEKAHLVSAIATTLPAESLIAARSVPDDGRQLLYPRLTPAAMATVAHIIDEWLPPAGVINSLLLMRCVQITG